MAGIGKLFKLGTKKPPEPPRKDYEGRDNGPEPESDEDGYMDPTTCHSVLPPSAGSFSSKMPNYPPPRPNHPNIAPKPVDLSSRIQHHNPGGGYKPPVKPRPVRTLRNKDGNQSKPVDDYSDPWDAKQNRPKLTMDDYCDPVDMTKPPAQAKIKLDDYSDPWDSRQGHIVKPRAKKTGVKDEYIDPWDAKGPQNSTQKEPDSDDESYTEPYDSGKVAALDEQAKRMSLRGMRLPSASNADHEHYGKPQTQLQDNRPTDDYESPWESKGLVLPPQTASKKQTLPKSGQMPVLDARPSEDYDKPWEWTATKQTKQYFEESTVSKTAKPQLPIQAPVGDSRPDTDYDAPWEYNKRSSQLVSIAQEQAQKIDGSAIPPKPPRAGNVPVESFTTDTSLPLEKQSWYHGPITRVEAECLLKHEDDCSFLVRDSESSKSRDYSLSFKNNNAFMHLKIALTPQGKYVLGQFSLPYDKVPEIIDYYSRNKLNIRGAVHSYLKNPVSPRHEYFVLEKS